MTSGSLKNWILISLIKNVYYKYIYNKNIIKMYILIKYIKNDKIIIYFVPKQYFLNSSMHFNIAVCDGLVSWNKSPPRSIKSTSYSFPYWSISSKVIKLSSDCCP